ncbi:hypothetical protein [Arthrobacter sp. H14]|nr:hypothetical protein [Arthrobacter sp. H14]
MMNLENDIHAIRKALERIADQMDPDGKREKPEGPKKKPHAIVC